MDMTADAIRELQKTAVYAERMNFVNVGKAIGNASVKTWAYLHDGKVVLVDEGPPCRDYMFETLSSLIAYAKTEDGASPPVLFYNHSWVQLQWDKTSRLERCAFRLVETAQQQLIAGPSIRESRDQRSFLHMLRIQLRGAVDTVLVDRLRRVKLSGQTHSNGTIEHGKESMGRSIENEVHGTEDIPACVTLSFPMYVDPMVATKVVVSAALEIEPAAGTFALVPYPDQLETMRVDALNRIKDVLERELPGYLALAGTPGMMEDEE